MLHTASAKIFVIDDDLDIQALLRGLFTVSGHTVETFSTGTEALQRLSALDPSLSDGLILCDLMLPDTTGLELIDRIRERGITLPILMITAHGTIETAIETMRRGAFDYITKPINLHELEILARRAISQNRLEESYRLLQQSVSGASQFCGIISRHPRMQTLFRVVETVARTTSSVLISGEHGVGKDLFARALHAKSRRAEKPLVVVNCSEMPEAVLGEELFGTRGRPGIIEECEGGTLLLEEVASLPLAAQAKLVRSIQDRKISDVRLVSTTSVDLKAAVQAGRFREDLHFRLSVVPIAIPALRERKEDIAVLTQVFLKKHCSLNALAPKNLTKSALMKLYRYNWPGNLRELESVIERGVVMSPGMMVDEHDLRIDGQGAGSQHFEGLFESMPSLEKLEEEYIRYVLGRVEHRKERAAEILGINRKSLYRKERIYNIASRQRQKPVETNA